MISLAQRLRGIKKASGGMPAIGPGPTDPVAYDATTDTGYYGETTYAQLITGDALATAIGLTAGTSQNSTAGWLKFWVGPTAACNRHQPGTGYVLFVAKKPLRYTVSWDHINNARPVDGSGAQITIGSLNYKVRLLTGADADPSTYTYGTTCAQNPGEGSEWNDLLYRIHTDTPNCATPAEGMPGGSETTRHGGPQVGADWAALTDADLITYYTQGSGSYCWCQEVDGVANTRRVLRGYNGVAYFYTSSADNAITVFGFRPCLELVPA
jgi:hypothetical protein